MEILSQQDRERRAWATELDLPRPGDAGSLMLNGAAFGEEWDGYAVESLGIRADAPTWPPPWPFYQLGPLLSRCYGRRVSLAGIAAFVDVRWAPDGAPMVSLRGLERCTLTEARRVLIGVKLVHTTSRRGSKRGGGQYPSAAAFHTARDAAIRDLRNEHIKPTPDQIMYRLFLNKSRYYELLQEYPSEDTRA